MAKVPQGAPYLHTSAWGKKSWPPHCAYFFPLKLCFSLDSCCVWASLTLCRNLQGNQQSLSLPLPWSFLQISLLLPDGFKLSSSIWQYPPKPFLTSNEEDLPAHQQTEEQRKSKGNQTTEVTNNSLKVHEKGKSFCRLSVYWLELLPKPSRSHIKKAFLWSWHTTHVCHYGVNGLNCLHSSTENTPETDINVRNLIRFQKR